MAADTLNVDTFTPKGWLQVWAGSVGENTDLTTQFPGLPARIINVGSAGTLVLSQAKGANVTFTAAQIANANGILLGQWTGIVASGSTAHTLAVGW